MSIYGGYEYFTGLAEGYARACGYMKSDDKIVQSLSQLSGISRRFGIKCKTKALIEQDRILTGREAE